MEEMKMKTIHALCFAALCAAAAVSCNKDIQEVIPSDGDNVPAQQKLLNPVTLTFTGVPKTKVVIDGIQASWEEGDRIKIISLDAEGNSKTVISEEVTLQNGGGRFTATVETSDVYYAVWPETLEVTLTKADEDGAAPVFTVDFGSAPEAKSVLGDAAYYAARTTADARVLDFRAISTIMEVKTETADATGILFGAYGSGITSCSGTFPVSFDAEGNVSLGKPASAKANVTFGIKGAGTYYLPLPGNGQTAADAKDGDGFILCLTKDGGNHTASYYENAVQLKPGKIYGLKDNVESRSVTDYYFSVDGKGTGLAADSPLAFSSLKTLPAFRSNTLASAMMRNGVTIHLAGGTYTTPLWTYEAVAGVGECKLTISGSTEAEAPTVFETTASSKFADSNLAAKLENVNFSGCTAVALIASCGSLALENCKFTSNTTKKGNGAAMTVNTNAFVTAKSCEFSANTAKNGAGLCITPPNPVVARQDAEIIFSCEDCLFSGNEVSGSGAAVLIAKAATGGQIRFNNCRFERNKVTGEASSAAALFCDNASDKPLAPMVFFNACSFWGNDKTEESTGDFEYDIYGNVGSRIAMNNCTFKAADSKISKNGSLITCEGCTVIANTTIWGSSYTSDRALAIVGSKLQDSPATMVNCLMNQNNVEGSSCQALLLPGGYYLNMSYSMYRGYAGDGTFKSSNCFALTEAPKKADYLTKNKPIACTIRGIKHEVFKYPFVEGEAATYPGFTLATKDAVTLAVESNAAIGTAFSAWLKELGAYDVDILGKPRVKIYPGSYHNTQE